MKISFTATQKDVQKAKELRDALENLLDSEISPSTRIVIQSIVEDINRFLSDPDHETKTGIPEADKQIASTPFEGVFKFWHFLVGPSNREISLSKQRAELIERAEHAENSAFEALAELADMKQEHGEVKQKLKKLEVELSTLKDKSIS